MSTLYCNSRADTRRGGAAVAVGDRGGWSVESLCTLAESVWRTATGEEGGVQRVHCHWTVERHRHTRQNTEDRRQSDGLAKGK